MVLPRDDETRSRCGRKAAAQHDEIALPRSWATPFGGVGRLRVHFHRPRARDAAWDRHVHFVREGWIAPAIAIGVIAVVVGSTMLFGVFPALVIDGARGFKAVGRSWRLARSHLGGSTIVIGSVLLSTWGVSIAIQLLTQIPLEPDGWGAILGASIAAVLSALTFSISAVVAVSLYLDSEKAPVRR